jgi:regulator of ribonuclease activity A
MTSNSEIKVSTPDICDAYEAEIAAGTVSVLDGIFNNYGKHDSFFGEAVTIKCFEDNSVLKKLVDTAGEGRVIVMDGGGSQRRAILGDMLAEKAASNGWAGLVINGCIRDCDEIAVTEIGVKALNTHPMKTEKRGLGDLNVMVTFAGQPIKPGNWVYSDNNGIVVSDVPLDI